MEVSNYRKFLGFTQKEMGEIFGLSSQSYARKERGEVAFRDYEKMKFKEMLLPYFPEIKIDDIFFN